MLKVTVLDYGAGNVRSVINALRRLGYAVKVVERAEDIASAERLVFPGVGEFGSMVQTLQAKGYLEPLRAYLRSGRPFLGICLGLQVLFERSEESPGIPGLGILRGEVRRFRGELSVPHIGWNGIRAKRPSRLFSGLIGEEKFYFVHSYYVRPEDPSAALATTNYGGEFASAVEVGNVAAVQFHPEKSGDAGLRVLRNFVEAGRVAPAAPAPRGGSTRLAKRIVVCLDVRPSESGKIVVTKGDRYDVWERGAVRDLGDPVELAERYYEEGADEIAFLNITGFRDFPLRDLPMLEVLERVSEKVFVPLTIGGGIRAYTDENGKRYRALEVAHEYFRSGADKVSIGSEAVWAAREYLRGERSGESPIEEIARVYGRQAVVVSVDPRRVYVRSPSDVPHRTVETASPGPRGERWCWYQCTVNGGRVSTDVDAISLARACEELGAGEILLNCIDRDGTGLGFDLELLRAVSEAVSIPVIASSGAGRAEHFSELFSETDVEAALAAGIFHRREVSISEVKRELAVRGIEVRAT